MKNLHRITGAIFTHFKPNLCPSCRHFQPPQAERDWEGHCAAKGTKLCCERSPNARCRDYATSHQEPPPGGPGGPEK